MNGADTVERELKSAKGGMGCLILFGAPFLLAGLASIWAGLNARGGSDPDENWWVGVVVGGFFAAVGTGIMAVAVFGRQKLTEEAALKRQYPDQPWMWRQDWAKGRVESDSKSTMRFAWIFAVFWNAISWVTVFAVRDEIRGADWKTVLLALFPLIGLGLLAWAITATLRLRKFGVSTLELSTLPGVVGGRLAGRIDTRLPEPPKDGMLLHLDCIRMVRSGDSTREQLVWKTEKRVPASRLSRGWQGVSIPVELSIPADAQETTRGPGRVLWRLAAEAQLAGVDFVARFEAPVFRTAESRRPGEAEPEEKETWTFASDREPAFDLSDATFVQRTSPLGGVEYYFPPRSQKRGAVGMTLFLVIWLGVLGAMFHFGAPWFFQALWALFALLIGLGALDAWFGSSTIRIEGEQVFASHGTLGRGRMSAIRFGEIARIKTDVGSTQSESMTQSSRAWWTVKAVRKTGGRDFVIAQNLRNQKEAEWLAEEIRRRIEKN